MRSSRQKSSISKLDLDQFVFTPPGSMGWQAHDSISAEKEEEEMHLAAGSIRELPNINAPKEYLEEKKEKETDREVTDDEATKFETVREPEEERASKRSTPRVEEEEEKEKEKETDREVTDDEATKFETVREPEEERASKRSAPPVEEEEEEEEPEQTEDDRVEIIILPSDSAPAPWVSNVVKRKA
ncbi:spore coat protein YtxO [Bacillus tequilensis]|nr:hypothetical protein [Bacillus tequilensis]SPU04869.1 spore coat protein YtxO [Bacillus tequilensis]